MVRVNPLYAFFISTLYLSYTYFIPPSYPLYTSLLSTLFLLHTYSTFYLLHTHNIPPLYPYPQYTFFIPTLYPPSLYPFYTSFIPTLYLLPCQLSQEKMWSRSPVCDTEKQRSWQSGSTDGWKRFLIEGAETLELLFLLQHRSGINSCYACLLKFNQRRHLSQAYIETGIVSITDRQYGHY